MFSMLLLEVDMACWSIPGIVELMLDMCDCDSILVSVDLIGHCRDVQCVQFKQPLAIASNNLGGVKFPVKHPPKIQPAINTMPRRPMSSRSMVLASNKNNKRSVEKFLELLREVSDLKSVAGQPVEAEASLAPTI